MSDLIPIERIESKILVLRDQKVLLDRDLAKLYEVPTSQLKRAVKRNIKRFPDGFMFVLSQEELEDWRCQLGTSNDKMGLRYAPMAFTEHGIAMLSSVLKSERAIQINIAIIKTFIHMREILLSNKEMSARLEDVEDRLGAQEFQTLPIIDQLGSIKKKLNPPKKKKSKIGFPEKK